MSLRDIQEKAKNAHTFGTATLTNKIERMHRNAREKQVVTFDISACEVDHLLSTTRERLPKPNRIIYRLVVDIGFFRGFGGNAGSPFTGGHSARELGCQCR